MLLSAPPTQQQIVRPDGFLSQTWTLFFSLLSKVTGRVTLTAGATSTVVQNTNITTESIVMLMPTTASAALDTMSGSLYVVSEKQQFTIYHDSDAATDRIFSFLVTK